MTEQPDHPFRLDERPGDEPVCADCGQHGDLYADGWDHARVDDVSRETDPIGQAIEKTEPHVLEHLIADFTFDVTGETMKLIVPIGFNADQFETAVATLMQLRVEAERRRAAAKPIITPPAPGKIVGLDGRRLT